MALSNDSRDTARSAGLHYASDLQAGILRYGPPGRFRYRLASGKPVKDRSVLKRIKSLVIPPAWKEVWIAPRPDSHLQATGRDARGRKQYRYHQTFAAHRDSAKYAHLVEFGHGGKHPAPPHPFLRPAFDAFRKAAVDMAGKEISERIIKRIVRESKRDLEALARAARREFSTKL